MARSLIVDTSFWIDFARGSLNEQEVEVLQQALNENRVILPQWVWLELFVGFRNPKEQKFLTYVRQLSVWVPLSEDCGTDAEVVAKNLRKRGLFLAASDLLVFTLALNRNAGLLHRDKDFLPILACPEYQHIQAGNQGYS